MLVNALRLQHFFLTRISEKMSILSCQAIRYRFQQTDMMLQNAKKNPRKRILEDEIQRMLDQAQVSDELQKFTREFFVRKSFITNLLLFFVASVWRFDEIAGWFDSSLQGSICIAFAVMT